MLERTVVRVDDFRLPSRGSHSLTALWTFVLHLNRVNSRQFGLRQGNSIQFIA